MTAVPFRYRSHSEDSARWLGLEFRDGDIVISTRSRTGTTWLQMICALLIFQAPLLPEPLAQLSPWLDDATVPLEELSARLAAQRHRRFIKTHTPLDGLPLDPRVSYIVTGRHPLDAAVSLYHQRDNIDISRLLQLTGQPRPAGSPPAGKPLRDWLLDWIAADDDPRAELDSLPGVMLHMSDAWARRGEPNVLLVHYDDLIADLDGQMRRLAGRLAITVPEPAWPALVHAATFESMRAEAASHPPSPGFFKAPVACSTLAPPSCGSGSPPTCWADCGTRLHQPGWHAASAFQLLPPCLDARAHRYWPGWCPPSRPVAYREPAHRR